MFFNHMLKVDWIGRNQWIVIYSSMMFYYVCCLGGHFLTETQTNRDMSLDYYIQIPSTRNYVSDSQKQYEDKFYLKCSKECEVLDSHYYFF